MGLFNFDLLFVIFSVSFVMILMHLLYDSIKRRLNEDGFDFSGITEVNIDSAQELEKINNDYSSLYRGVGIYDKDGNMSTYFKKTMIYKC